MSIARRQFIQAGFGGAAILTLAGCASAAPSDEDAMLRAVAATMLAGSSTHSALTTVELDRAVRGIRTAVRGLPPAVQAEVAQLFALLTIPLSRLLVARVPAPWSSASRPEVAGFLERWRASRVLLFRSGYQALHQLVMAGWYGGDAAWAASGYGGPPHLG